MTRPLRLAVLSASPVYYQTPLYRELARDPRVDPTVFFCSTSGIRPGDLGFGRPVAWDVDPLEGFRAVFLRRADRTDLAGGLLALRDLDVVRELVGGRYDALWLHGYYSLTHLLAALTMRLQGKPIFVREEQTTLGARPTWKRALKRVLFRVLFGRATALSIGTENRKWFLAQGIPAERIAHVPYAVENDSLRAEAAAHAASRAELRDALGVAADGGPVILTVGRIEPRKQPLHLLEAFRRVRAGRRCTLVFVGTGELEPELRAAAAGVPDVVLAGFRNRSEIAAAYAAADVFALPSASETWGIAVNEALNFALPVVVTDRVGCAADLVRDGENGFVVDAGDVDELAARLARLVDSAELRAAFGERSRELVSRFTYERAAAGALDALAGAAHAHVLPAAVVEGVA